MKTFDDLKFKKNGLNKMQAILFFKNGYGVSVIHDYGCHTNNDEEYDLAIIYGNEKYFGVKYDTGLTEDVIAYINSDEVTEIMKKVQLINKNKTSMLDKLLDMIEEKLDWRIESCEDDYIRLSNHSPEGGEIGIEIENCFNVEKLLSGVKEYYNNFDLTENTLVWVNGTKITANGCPDNIVDLVNDIVSQKEMIEELVDFISLFVDICEPIEQATTIVKNLLDIADECYTKFYKDSSIDEAKSFLSKWSDDEYLDKISMS